MSLSLILWYVWVITATLVAFLPMRLQYPPGILLLIAAPCLLGWIAFDHGWWIFVAGTVGFVSMFRKPLIYIFRKWTSGETHSPS